MLLNLISVKNEKDQLKRSFSQFPGVPPEVAMQESQECPTQLYRGLKRDRVPALVPQCCQTKPALLISHMDPFSPLTINGTCGKSDDLHDMHTAEKSCQPCL